MDYSKEQLKVIEKFLYGKEQSALEFYREFSGHQLMSLPKEIRETLETTFLIGFGHGGLEHEEDLRKLQKDDPINFYKWVEGSL